ncbi:hypothetical protein CHS0354_022368, partial [Potamilus streckersoni]
AKSDTRGLSPVIITVTVVSCCVGVLLTVFVVGLLKRKKTKLSPFAQDITKSPQHIVDKDGKFNMNTAEYKDPLQINPNATHSDLKMHPNSTIGDLI